MRGVEVMVRRLVADGGVEGGEVRESFRILGGLVCEGDKLVSVFRDVALHVCVLCVDKVCVEVDVCDLGVKDEAVDLVGSALEGAHHFKSALPALEHFFGLVDEGLIGILFAPELIIVEGEA